MGADDGVLVDSSGQCGGGQKICYKCCTRTYVGLCQSGDDIDSALCVQRAADGKTLAAGYLAQTVGNRPVCGPRRVLKYVGQSELFHEAQITGGAPVVVELGVAASPFMHHGNLRTEPVVPQNLNSGVVFA